jgi:ABC-type antimicrobial peptide transport system permease subunit
MLKNYIRIAWRNLRKNRTSSIINITGLATGMAIALIIGLWIADELSFDHYHTHHSRIAQGMAVQSARGDIYVGETITQPLGKALRTYKDLFTRTALMYGGGDHLIGYGDKKLNAPGIWAQRELPEMFTFQMVKGSIAAADDPSTALISQSLATALFGKDDPINKDIQINNRLQFRVGGVYKDLPHNTTFAGVKLVMPWYNKENNYRINNTEWGDHNGNLYVELADGVTAEQATARIRSLPTPHVKEWKEEAMVYPLDKAHLYNQFNLQGQPSGGRIQFVWLFGIIGAFVLLLACINFMNLSTARSEKRAKEVGIRKTVGSLKSQLIAQFLSESVVVTFLAFLLSIILAELSLPFFNGVAAKEMAFPWTNSLFWLLAIGFILFTGIIAGSYPAFYLSSFDPVQVLKGTFRAGRFASLPRKVLVVLQFSVSLSLIIGTIIVFRQISFAKDRPVGYAREGLVAVYMNTPSLYEHYDAIREELLRKGVAENVAASSMKPTNFDNNNSLYWRGKRPDQDAIFFRNVNVTRDFGKTIGWHVLQGRDFSRDFPSDSGALILNDTAAKVMGIPNPIGERVKFWGKNYTVIGVVGDMITNSPFDKIEPAIFLGDMYRDNLIARLAPGLSTSQALAGMESVFKKFNPGNPFVYNFIDEEYARKFEAEQRIGNLASVFTSLAIFISCIGLFGLASFVAEQRTKEIGVRKVLGAGVFRLWGLLSKDFLKLVILSFCIAMPLAWYAMNKWLEGYVYHTTISWWIFAASGIGILVVTLLTVSFQSLRAATMNPSKSLRTE